MQVYHPNIDLEGKICLNILREDWKPVLSISSVVYGLQFLFLDPNPDDPLNKEAAQAFVDNPRQFETQVQRAIMHGNYIKWVWAGVAGVAPQHALLGTRGSPQRRAQLTRFCQPLPHRSNVHFPSCKA